MCENKIKILIGAGGTGGHIIPAINIGKNISCIEPLFVTGIRSIEKTIYDNYDINPLRIPIRKLNSIYDIIVLIVSVFIVCNIIVRYRIKFVFIMGSYMTIPIGIASIIMQKPLFIMEQDFIAGKTIKLFSIYAHKIFVGFNKKYRYIPNRKVVITGHMINHIKLINNLNKQKNKKTILILGGSQGAKELTQKLYSILNNTRYYTIIVAGNYYKDFNDTNNIKILPFQDNLSYLYSISDLIISRAGAMSVAELMFVKKPCIFIPFAKATDNHQMKNIKHIINNFPFFKIIKEDSIDKHILKVIKTLLKMKYENMNFNNNNNNNINIIEREFCNV